MKKIPRLMDVNEIMLYDTKATMQNVKKYFAKYRNYKDKLSMIKEKMSTSLGEDNMGIYSSNISDPTGAKVEQSERYSKYIEYIDANLKIIRKNLTEDEKAILKLSILDSKTDEFIAEYISVAIQNFYQRKKSCYIKVACYFDIDVERDV